MYRNIKTWDHFENIGGNIAECKYCNHQFAAKNSNSIFNLNMHVFLQHGEQVGVDNNINKVSGKWCSVMWEYFSKISEDKLAVCHLCNKVLSFKTSSTNLKVHLSRKHEEAYLRLINNLPPEENIDKSAICPDTSNEIEPEASSFTNDSSPTTSRRHSYTNDISADEDSDDSGHQSTDVRSYFEQETGGRVRCIVCRASRSNDPAELKKHLREKHPKLIGAIGQDVQESDASGNEDKGTFTEVIYLEEDSKKTPKYVYKKEHKAYQSDHKKNKKEKTRKLSSSSDELPLKKQKDEDLNELETFLTYIRCLLRQVPTDVCAKLQMDIINLIVNAKLNKTNNTEVTVLETSMGMAKDIMDRTGVITVTEIPVNNTSTEMDPVDHCYMDVVSDKADN